MSKKKSISEKVINCTHPMDLGAILVWMWHRNPSKSAHHAGHLQLFSGKEIQLGIQIQIYHKKRLTCRFLSPGFTPPSLLSVFLSGPSSMTLIAPASLTAVLDLGNDD